MALRAEVLDIVRILDDEGFGIIAGDLLVEIASGAPTVFQREPSIHLATPTEDRAISEEFQLHVAMKFLRQRLLQPAFALAEAERVLSEFQDRGSVRIKFVEPENGTARVPSTEAPPGDHEIPDRLDALLTRIAALSTGAI